MITWSPYRLPMSCLYNRSPHTWKHGICIKTCRTFPVIAIWKSAASSLPGSISSVSTKDTSTWPKVTGWSCSVGQYTGVVYNKEANSHTKKWQCSRHILRYTFSIEEGVHFKPFQCRWPVYSQPNLARIDDALPPGARPYWLSYFFHYSKWPTRAGEFFWQFRFQYFMWYRMPCAHFTNMI